MESTTTKRSNESLTTIIIINHPSKPDAHLRWRRGKESEKEAVAH
jgi:hypothetical protein